MASAQAQFGHHEHAHGGPRAIPSDLRAPAIVGVWRTRALLLSGVFGVLSFLFFVWTHEGRNHLLRAYLMGYMMCFSFSGGGLVMLMLQYVSGGKWGLLLRRPLEAMSRSLWMVLAMFVPIPFFWKHLYQWAAFPTAEAKLQAVRSGLMTQEQQLTAQSKVAMLNPGSVLFQTFVIFAVLLTFVYFLNKWSLQRDADPARGTERSFDYWRTKTENLSGIGIFIYVVLLTVGAIDWIKSLDVTWYSSIWGLQFLVGQGYAVLALGVLTVILLSRFQPMQTLLRVTEQHDLGKFMFAFVMLNIYLTFAEFLIIWSGNLPDEIPWYLNRIHGGWWTICTLDVVCHWLIPFCLLLSRDLKRSKHKMILLTCFMIFARCLDMFWLIEPNFKDAAGNLHLAGNVGILAYITVPIAVISLWMWFYLGQLQARPLLNVNDADLEGMLEPDHAH